MPRPNGGPRLVRKAGRDEWYVQRTIDGRTERISTRTADRETAEGFLAAFLTENVQRPVTHDPYLQEILAAYIDFRAPNVASPGNLKDRAKRLNEILGLIKASEVNAELGRTYLRKRTGVSDATKGDELALLNAATRWASMEGRVSAIAPVKLPPRPPARDRWLHPQEARLLIASAQSAHVRLFISLMLATASRPGALLELQWSQVDLTHNRIHLNPPGRVQTAKRRVTVPISVEVGQELAKAKLAAQTVNVIECRGAPVGSIKKAFSRTVQRAGLSKVTPHTLRHTAATWMAQDGVTMFEIAGILGHTTTRTTEIYAKHSPDFMRAATTSLGKRLSSILPSIS